MKHPLELIMNATHTNVILVSAPHRFDLMETSCVNHEIENFNRKLRKRLERLEKVQMIDVDDRNLLTRHSQHLNSVGKECRANKIALTIKGVLNKKVQPISGKWYTDNKIPGSPIAVEDTVQDKSIHKRPRLSKRQKKPPTTRSDNFLW